MLDCPSCGEVTPEGGTFCPSCGSRLDLGSSSRSPSSSASSVDRGTIAPGNLIASRYRVVALAGRGGMGEVYEADDLTLGQVVALKFLPPHLEADDEGLEHLLDEVRIARRVSHPNVARVYDIGSVDERHFLTMEFVRGEDLGQLLKRIGRLPSEKGIEIAHQICAGLAAAHDEGVLHRDLKPANVLLDANGKVHLTDFGLAVLAHDQDGGIAGTPAYMSPEQIRGHTLTVRSEVYSLGVLLYELATGRRAFEGELFEEFARQHNEGTPTAPSSIVDSIDPQIERVILSCLEKDPMRRPRSARAVSAALPGGDALAAALAAGQTPSPEVVAEAGATTELLRPGVVVALAVLCCALAALAFWARASNNGWNAVGAEKAPEVLVERARALIAQAGYTDPPVDSGFWFVPGLAGDEPGFVYRQSPDVLSFRGERLTRQDPAPTLPGMIEVRLLTDGTLREFSAVPEDGLIDAGASTHELDLGWVLQAASLDSTVLQPAEPRVPLSFADDCRTWTLTGKSEEDAGVVQILAASLNGRLVQFHRRVELDDTEAGFSSLSLAVAVCFMATAVTLLLATVLLAWRNLRLGRGDRRGAARVTVFVLCANWLASMLAVDHIAGTDAFFREFRTTALSVFSSSLVWVGYLAFEPFVRRKWPHVLITWTRVIARRLDDPLVGRDLLVGVACGTALAAMGSLMELAPAWIADTPAELSWGNSRTLFARGSIAMIIGSPWSGCILGMACVLTIAFLRRVIGRAGLVVWVLVMAVFPSMASDRWLSALVSGALLGTLLITLLMRFGLLALVVTISVAVPLTGIALTLDPSSWYFQNVVFASIFVLGLTAWGARAALAGRPILREEL
ncbi:MAG: serine/threonine-protein kinase [Planctomycetota bacterium]|jgi:serine/threonine-protein kinase